MLGCVVLSMDIGSGNSNQSVLHNCLTIYDGFYSLDSSFTLTSILLITTHVIEDVPPLVGVVFLILRKTAIQKFNSKKLYGTLK